MAQATKQTTRPEEGRRSLSSSGRGGAGNITSNKASGAEAKDLSTPHLRADSYTTGRGGSGNIRMNDKSNPSIARAAQDVEAPAHLENDLRKGETYHWGRGGEGNMMKVGADTQEQKPRRGSLVEKGKVMLGFLGKKQGSESGGVGAVAEGGK